MVSNKKINKAAETLWLTKGRSKNHRFHECQETKWNKNKVNLTSYDIQYEEVYKNSELWARSNKITKQKKSILNDIENYKDKNNF